MRIKAALVVCLILVLIMSCKKINLLSQSYPNINEKKPEISDHQITIKTFSDELCL